jgi:uncharacterized membrane protein
MGEQGDVILYVGVYQDRGRAVGDFQAISDLRHEGQIGDFEAAVFQKKDDGDIHIIDTTATERAFGAKVGAATGAVIGLLFPPALLGTALAGAGVGALTGHFMRGLKRDDIRAMGEMLDTSELGVVLIGFSKMDEAGLELLANAESTQQFAVASDPDEMTKMLQDAAADSGGSE